MKPILLHSSPKGWTADLDKAFSPRTTLDTCFQKLNKLNLNIISEIVRADHGRLGIPVYMAKAGLDALNILPTRKQMGKGSSPEQAQASAVMELVERYSFFSFWETLPDTVCASWGEAKKLFGKSLIPIQHILSSVNDNLAPELAEQIMNSRKWLFYPATNLQNNQIVWLPIDWFRMLGEFNGSSAGNNPVESLLQGLCELIERHVCGIISATSPCLPTINQKRIDNPVINRLLGAFAVNGIKIILKDFSMDMPVPTVGALAWDPATFPHESEIVFTAGTATSPAKAAIRAITEVAQLAGDFNSCACYEASGLPKFKNLEDFDWLLHGPVTSLSALPTIEHSDMLLELQTLIAKLAPLPVYAISTTQPELDIGAHWCIVPGLQFRERDQNQSLGLFAGRKLAEEDDPQMARNGLALLAKAYPNAHFLPFFEGLLNLRENKPEKASQLFAASIPMQPDANSAALAAFYAGYAQTLCENWQNAIPFLEHSLDYAPDLKESANLLGVSHFKLGNYDIAEIQFDKVLKIDKGSAVDLANRGICRKLQGKSATAQADLQNALSLDPSLEFARKHLMELMENH